jgi:hypothetical protein
MYRQYRCIALYVKKIFCLKPRRCAVYGVVLTWFIIGFVYFNITQKKM